MKKRPVSVVVVASLMILAGGISGCGAAFSAMAGGVPMERLLQQINQQIDAAVAQSGSSEAVAQQVTEMRSEINRRFGEMKALMDSPAMRAGWWAQSFVGFAAIIGGFGILAAAGWARPYVTGQAILSIVIGVWWLTSSPMTQLQQGMQRLTTELLGQATLPSARAEVQQSMGMAQTIGQALSGALLVAWNGFLIWFVNRRRPTHV